MGISRKISDFQMEVANSQENWDILNEPDLRSLWWIDYESTDRMIVECETFQDRDRVFEELRTRSANF